MRIRRWRAITGDRPIARFRDTPGGGLQIVIWPPDELWYQDWFLTESGSYGPSRFSPDQYTSGVLDGTSFKVGWCIFNPWEDL